MKHYLLFLMLLASPTLFAQKDTVFLTREVADKPYPFYHAVFIDTTSTYRNELTSFSSNNFDSATYFEILASIQPLTRGRLPENHTFPQRWIALYRLNNNYYLYRPSDLGNHFKFEITDSTTIDFTMEGPEPSRLNKISFPSSTQAFIERSSRWEGKKVQISIIDTTRGIAIFNFSPTKYKKASYKLMVDATKAHLFPTVVNYCPTDKQMEVEFDKIDFKTLMN